MASAASATQPSVWLKMRLKSVPTPPVLTPPCVAPLAQSPSWKNIWAWPVVGGVTWETTVYETQSVRPRKPDVEVRMLSTFSLEVIAGVPCHHPVAEYGRLAVPDLTRSAARLPVVAVTPVVFPPLVVALSASQSPDNVVQFEGVKPLLTSTTRVSVTTMVSETVIEIGIAMATESSVSIESLTETS